MPLRSLAQATQMIVNASGPEDAPPAVYLPGVHGCWTTLQGARPILAGTLRLIEISYPQLPHWSIEDYGDALHAALDALGLESAHLIGESFGSLVAWQLSKRNPERVRSHILVGGFVQPPRHKLQLPASWILHAIPSVVLDCGIDSYVALNALRGHQRSSNVPGVPPYPVMRTARGRLAAAGRMRIIHTSDFRRHLPSVRHQVRYVGGAWDFTIPIYRELATLRSMLAPETNFEAKLLPRALHPILASHPEPTARSIVDWISSIEAKSKH